MDNEQLESIFVKAGEGYGYERVRAEFFESMLLTVRWVRVVNEISFQVTDYLMDAPREAIESLADTIFSRMFNDADKPYDEAFIRYVTSDNFAIEAQPVYLSRLEGASASPVGRCKDLRKSVRRLREKGLIKLEPHTYIGWLPMDSFDNVGNVSFLLRSVCINKRLNSCDFSDDMLDFCVYSQMKKLEQDIGDPKNNKMRLEESIERYPNNGVYMSELESIGLSIWSNGLEERMSPEC